MVISGNEALSLGAFAGGCRFVAAYPMTPATSIFQWFVNHAEKYPIVARQAEDEIAAACLAIGAAHAGARVLVPTSGGGFSLMVEAVGLAGMSETPLVIVVAQRPGPATGLSTRTEQPDLLFTINASQGDFPKIVLAPGTPEQCFEAGWRAMNLADKYQTPVFILTDAFLASSQRTLDPEKLELNAVKIDRGRLLTATELDTFTGTYRRYQLTASGISPRVLPGHPNAIFQATSNEHNESGHICETAGNREAMNQKRMHKLNLALEEMRPPILHGPTAAEITFVCWGSTLAPLQEAVTRLNIQKPDSANILQFTDLWPFPAAEATLFLESARKLIAVEGNTTGQLARLIRAETGIAMFAKILKFDGRPFSPEFILEKLKEAR
jgi:2-oxoglutarate ferredoxin oxidoreductase subunit alpha